MFKEYLVLDESTHLTMQRCVVVVERTKYICLERNIFQILLNVCKSPLIKTPTSLVLVMAWHIPSYKTNSHIRHSRPGRALLRWTKECGRLWVQLASAVQAPIHSVAYTYIDSYSFLSVTSSVMITCIYTFTADDNHLQTSTILNSAVSHYTGHQYMPSTQVSPILSEKLTRKSYGTFALKGCYTRSLLIIWWYLLYHLKSYLAKIVRMVLNIR